MSIKEKLTKIVEGAETALEEKKTDREFERELRKEEQAASQADLAEAAGLKTAVEEKARAFKREKKAREKAEKDAGGDW